MAGPQRPQPQRQMQGGATQGPHHRVPCPYCHGPLDFRAHLDADGGGSGWGDQGMEAGNEVECDHCGRKSKILAIEKITVVRLAPL